MGANRVALLAGLVSLLLDAQTGPIRTFGYTASRPPGSTVPAFSILSADCNGDGIPDLVSGTIAGVTAWLGLRQQGFSGPLESRRQVFGSRSVRIANGDWNHDGKLDLVTLDVTQLDQYSLTIWLGDGFGGFRVAEIFALPSSGELAVADFNRDGSDDFAVGLGREPHVAVFLSRGDGRFAAPLRHQLIGNSGDSPLTAAADMNGDNVPDLVTVTSGTVSGGSIDKLVSVWLGRGDGSFASTFFLKDDSNVVSRNGALGLGDLNGDGILDVVVQNDFSYVTYRSSVSVFLGAGGGALRPAKRSVSSNTGGGSGIPVGILVEDFTGDGRADVAALFQFNNGRLQLFPGNGDGTLQTAAVFEWPLRPSGFVSVDFDRDGRRDFAAVWENNGFGLFRGTPAPLLRITKSLSGVPRHRQPVSFTITVANSEGGLPAEGTVTITEIPRTNLDLLSLRGDGWDCRIYSCTREGKLEPGAQYPPVTVQIQPSLGGVNRLESATSVSGAGSAPTEAILSARVFTAQPEPELRSLRTAGAETMDVIAPNTWMEIQGFNLVPEDAPTQGVLWSGAPEFASGRLPTELAGVSVTVNGRPAYVYYYCSRVTSPVCEFDQINALTPLDAGSGTAEVNVRIRGGTIVTLRAQLRSAVPSFYLFEDVYPAATLPDGSIAGSRVLFPGVSRPVRPGEVVSLWGTGFGLPPNPLTAGSASQSGVLSSPAVCSLGDRSVSTPVYLVGPGLYQVNLTVPSDMPDSLHLLRCAYANASTRSYLTPVER